MSFPLQHLGSQVRHAPAETLSPALDFLLAQPEIRQSRVPIAINHDIGRFQVTEDDAVLMQFFQCQSHFRRVKFDKLLWERTSSEELLLKVTARAILQDKV
jgi:hypothetical protein